MNVIEFGLTFNLIHALQHFIAITTLILKRLKKTIV
jgi:hypothetical protein